MFFPRNLENLQPASLRMRSRGFWWAITAPPDVLHDLKKSKTSGAEKAKPEPFQDNKIPSFCRLVVGGKLRAASPPKRECSLRVKRSRKTWWAAGTGTV